MWYFLCLGKPTVAMLGKTCVPVICIILCAPCQNHYRTRLNGECFLLLHRQKRKTTEILQQNFHWCELKSNIWKVLFEQIIPAELGSKERPQVELCWLLKSQTTQTHPNLGQFVPCSLTSLSIFLTGMWCSNWGPVWIGHPGTWQVPRQAPIICSQWYFSLLEVSLDSWHLPSLARLWFYRHFSSVHIYMPLRSYNKNIPTSIK